MSDKRTIYSDPSKVEASEGAVEVHGPDDVAVALTPEAAEETSDRLLRGAFKARGQQRLGKLPHRQGRLSQPSQSSNLR